MVDDNMPAIREMTPFDMFWHKIWFNTWLARTIFSKRFWNEPFDDYPQSWYYMPHWKWLRTPLQFLCGLRGHEPSKTEWGYGGGGKVDTWCRWCNHVSQVPISEARFRYPTFNKMRPDQGFISSPEEFGIEPNI